MEQQSSPVTPYVTAKAALVGLARSLAGCTRALGVGVTLLCPSLTATAFPTSARMWGPSGPSRRTMRLPEAVDTPERVADQMIEAIRAGRFLASAVFDLAPRLAAWAADPDAALPALR